MSRYGGYIYSVTLSYNIRYFVFWFILDDNAVLMSLITKKTVYWAIIEANIYVTLPPKIIEFPQHLMVKIFLWNDFYVTISLWKLLNCANNKIENVWRLYFRKKSIRGV